ncbi:spore cortex biosynthesis protein YabQ [Halobacillus halophilus]|uniref:spore cortex biosynthesis protein YabQ n=1 Tax=Halobacillus halophilus TaxID=1570 RepID=UPI001CD420AB|nr:spore cortex biosynthesis protein YabQ [Halobacillus halophilus]MCA1013021.1 spore cortex biosynthesis protein YabQ [Halobacillus halophilus]
MTLTTQFVTILSMIAGGIFVGASLDTFERLFHKRNKKSWFEIIYQLTFWISQAALLFYLLYLANYGELRVYVFLAVLCGYAAYRAILQSGYMKMLEVWIRVVTSILRGIKKIFFHLIFIPLKSIFFLIITLLIGIFKILLKGIFLLFLVAFYPIKVIFRLIWRLLPKNTRNYLRRLAGFLDKIKNIGINWIKKFRK